MAADDIEKGKKKRRRTATVHFYENMNKPSRPRSEALAELRRDEAEECAAPDMGKAAGNPVPGRNYSADRLSEPLTAGHQAPSVGDHGVGAGRNPGLAEHHAGLDQSTTRPAPWFSMRSVNGDNIHGDRDITHSTGAVGVSFLDLRAASPASDALMPAANPAARQMSHIASGSATPPTPGHSRTDPLSHAAPAAAKGAGPVGGRAAMEMLRQNAEDAVSRLR